MKVIRNIALFVFALCVVGLSTAPAQEVSGPRTSQAYYRMAPGTQDEWLALFKECHYPVLMDMKSKGLIKTFVVYKRDRHHLSPAWDYELQIVWRDKVAQAHETDPAVMHKLFPDYEKFQKDEARRVALAIEHWDEDLSPVIQP